MGKHKKKLREEKSKVKLKTSAKTKFLPKGQNVTDTTFKVKAIVLPEQLKSKNKDIPLSKRSLDIKDLVVRLKHYNENVRHSACEEITDMLKHFRDEMIQNHLSVLVKNVTTLVQDKCGKVRAASVAAIDKLLEYATAEKIEPFFSFILVNLRCAMTNINKTIQEDSLMLLDALLKHVSNLVARNPEKVLTDFFTLISKLRSDSQVDRTLTVNLNSKMTSVSWRLKVLSRLYQILKAIMSQQEENGCNCIHYNFNQTTHALYNTNLNDKLEKCDLDFLNNNTTDVEIGNVKQLNKHIMSLMPLLYETWIEVVPDKGFKTENTILNEEAAAMLSCVMKIAYLLFEYTKINYYEKNLHVSDVFLSIEGKKFLKHLVSNFPYSQGEKIKQKQKSKSVLSILESNDDPKCVEQNLLICYIYSILYIHTGTKNSKIHNIVMYITKVLLSSGFINGSNIKYLVLILRSILLEDTKLWERNNVAIESILEHTITFYKNSRLLESTKLDMFAILVDVSENNLVKSTENYDKWIQNTVNCLWQPEISAKKVKLLLTMAKRGNTAFLESFYDHWMDVLGNIHKIKILDCEDEELIKMDILKIFYYLLQEPMKPDSLSYSKQNAHLMDYLKMMLNLRASARQAAN